MKIKKGLVITVGIVAAVLVVSVVVFSYVLVPLLEEYAEGVPLYFATVNNDLDEMKTLIDAGKDVNEKGLAGHTPLIVVARKNYIEAAKLLLENGANPNVKDDLGWAPLHHAVLRKVANDNIIRILIEYGAQVNVVDLHKRTPLHRAAEFGHIKTVKLLLDLKADPKALDENARTPSDRAIKHPEIVALIEEYVKGD